ncbi:MAG TPA: hypothetical protein PL003_05410, partial [Bacteroidales bacterium]|nr:hypothetical protein [Bacteroidales bacterium]
MSKSLSSGFRRVLFHARKLPLSLITVAFFVQGVSAQPVWTSGPAFTPKPTSVDVTFTLDVNSTVYYFAYPFSYPIDYSSAQVRNFGLNGGASICDYGSLTYSTPGVPATITVNNFPVSTTVTIYIVAATDPGGVLQATPVKQYVTTLPCPEVYFDNGLQQFGNCVNLGANKRFNMYPDPDPYVSGILKDTEWVIDWGDGTVYNYISAFDGDYPDLASRSHTYNTADDCNYVFFCSVRNPCGKTFSPQYVAVVHGRDWWEDGDGVLDIVNNADGSNIIEVCAGTETTITVRDNSTWNCQNPTVPGGLTAVPNLDMRNIEWLYGVDVDKLTPRNTITGTVTVSGLGDAPQWSGRITPAPYGPSSLAQAVTIPATCQAGEYFRIYLKNWNKCNWADPLYVYTYVDILVIASPPAPTVPDKTICFGGDRELVVTSTPIGTLTWYSDIGLTTIVATNTPTYTPSYTGPGSISFWVTDQSTDALACMSPATQVTLTINPIPNTPTISRSGPDFCFDGISSVTLTANPNLGPPISGYQWYRNGTAVGGATNQTIILNSVGQSGEYTVQTFGIPTTNCPSLLSAPVTVLIDQMPTATVGAAQNFCGTLSTSRTLSGNTPVGGATGYWSYPVIWREDFNDLPNGTTVDNGPTAWTRTNPGSMDWAEVRDHRFEAKEIDGECIWRSETVDITGFTNVGVSVRLIASATCDAGSDYIRAYYILNGGGETALDNGIQTGPSGTDLATVNNLNGTSLQIVIKMFNQQDNEYYYIDDVIIAEGGAPAITDPSNPTSTVTNLPQGPTVFTWTVSSQYGICPPASANLTITRDGQPSPADAGSPQAFCETTTATMAATPADNGGIGTWSLQSGSGSATEPNNPASPVTGLGYGANVFRWTVTSQYAICSGSTDDVTITRNRNPLDRSAGTTIVKNPVCYNTAGQIQITNTEADVKYYLHTGGADGSFVQGNGGTITLTTPPLTSATTYEIHAIKDGTGCNIYFGSYTINVNPEFTLAQLQTSHNICFGDPTTISVILTGGTGPYSVTINNSIGTISPYNSGDPIPTPALLANTTYTLTAASDANSCVPASLGTSITITVGSTPTAATFSGSGNACLGATSFLTFTVTDGVPPFDLIINGTTYLDRASGSNIDLGALTEGIHNYSLTSIIDACGNPVPAGILPLNYSIDIDPIPDISGSTPLTQNICSEGTATITLNSTVNNTIFNYVIESVVPATGYSWTAGRDPVGGTITDTDGNGTESLTRQLQHNYNAPVTVTYRITPTGPGGTACPGTAITRTVVVNPTPAISNMSTSACSATAFSGTPVNGTNGVVPAGTTYSWTAPSVPAGLSGGAGGSGGSIIGTLTNTTNGALNATYTVTPTSGSCPGADFDVVVTVNPRPAINDMTGSACSGAGFTVTPVNVTNGIVPAVTTYTWSAPSVQPGLTGGAGGSGNSITGTLTNTTNAALTATYTVTPTSGSCQGPDFDVVVTVNPRPAINDMTGSACSGDGFTVTPVNVTNGIVPAGTTYTWNAPSVQAGLTGGAAGSGNNITGTLTNTTNAALTATYTVTPTSGSCQGADFDVVITVNPRPAINDMTGSACSGDGFTVTPVNVTNGIVPAVTTYT